MVTTTIMSNLRFQNCSPQTNPLGLLLVGTLKVLSPPQEGYVFGSVYLSLCRFVSRITAKLHAQFFIKLCRRVQPLPRKNPFNFGADPSHGPDTIIIFHFCLHCKTRQLYFDIILIVLVYTSRQI